MDPTHEPSSESDGEDDPLDALLIECMERLNRGEAGAIDAACAADPEHAVEIRERIGLLLQMGLVPSTAEPEQFPERLDQFRLLKRLGGGGMGVVYEAEQEPIGRVVALKLIRPEQLYFPRARERFRRETEAVAKLQHPGIVAIYTVGEAAGIPYFAMEKIAGATLADVLARVDGRAPESLRGRDLRAALGGSGPETEEARELFRGTWAEACVRIVARVAEALAHAHSRGVLHRDVKPSNVVVTPDGRVVLLDFGLASSSNELRMTLNGSALGSVLYMAPEQIRGRINEIDERTDVYALGVTLYELVTLQVPFIGDDAEQARAAILDGRPESIRARNRGVSRDLEIVCTTAIERDRARRYASTEALARDLRNALEHRPISARPPSAVLRAARWVQRNPTASVAIAAAALLVVGVPLALYVQQRGHNTELRAALDAQTAARRAADDESARAEREKERAEDERERAQSERERAQIEARSADQVASFLIDLFRAADPNQARGRELSARDLLRRGVERIESNLADQPEIQARLLDRVGQSFMHLDAYTDALPLIERALELRRALPGTDDVETARLLASLGKLRRLLGRGDSLGPLQQARELFDACEGPDARLALQCESERAIALIEQGRARDALALVARAQAAQERNHPRDIELRERLRGASMLAYLALHRFDEAETAAREALDLAWQVYRAPHPAVIADLNGLASALSAQGRAAEGLEAYDDVLALARKVYGENSPSYAMSRMNRAVLLESQGRVREAEPDFRASFTSLRQSLGDHHPNSVRCLGNLTHVWTRLGRYGEALELCRQVLGVVVERAGPASELTLLVAYRLAAAHEALGEFEQAERVLRQALVGAGNAARRQTAWIEIELAGVLRRNESSRSEARAILEGVIGRCIPMLERQARYDLARLALDEGRIDDADAVIDEALQLPEPTPDEGWPPSALRALSGARAIERGELDEGAAAVDEGLAQIVLELGARHAECGELLALAERAWSNAGRRDLADALHARFAEVGR